MNKVDYLLKAFSKRAYVNKGFMLSIFSKVPQNQNEKLTKLPYALMRDDEKKELYFFEDGNKIVLDIYTEDSLFDINEEIEVDGTVSPTVKEKITTTIGVFIVNIIVLYEALKDNVTYINDVITSGDIKKIINNIMVDNPEVGEIVPEGKSPVDDCLKITQQLDYLVGMNPIFVKAGSVELFTIDPEIIKLRDKLLDELEKEGKLNDEVAVSKVIDILVAKDAEIQYNGPSKDLFIDPKFVENCRKKMFIVFDMVPDFHTGKYELLRNSLKEGWDKSQYPAYINTAINASHGRGVGTAQGGAEVKVAMLLTNTMEIGSVDCGTLRTEKLLVTERGHHGWLGGYYVDKNKVTLFDKEKAKEYMGKYVNMRSPQYCKEPGNNICRTCAGEPLGSLKERLSAEVVYIFSGMMLTRMKAMHVSVLKTVKINLFEAFK